MKAQAVFIVEPGKTEIRQIEISSPFITTDHNINYMARAVRLMEKGVFDQRELITHRHHVRDVQQAMVLADQRPDDYIKGVLLFDEW